MRDLAPFSETGARRARFAVAGARAVIRCRSTPVAGSPATRPRAKVNRILAALLFVAIAGALLAVPPAGAAEWGLAQLMEGLAQRGAERAMFVEKKFIAILDQPLESSGELRYAPPDRLEKRTFRPRPESVVLERATLTVERGDQKHTLRLQDYPEIAVFIESMRATLAGDRKALERVFRLELHGNRERWTLVMFPSDAKLAAMVLRVDVAGTRSRLRSIEVLQADGDRSVMTIEPLADAAGAAAGADRKKAAPR